MPMATAIVCKLKYCFTLDRSAYSFKNSRCTSLGILLLFPHYAQIHGSVHNMMPDENILKKKIIHSVVLNSVTWHLIRLLEVRVMN